MKVLLVENDPEWLESISRSLPDYDVDLASSYSDALACLASGLTYDVAIVDLNLIDSGGHNAGDLLGGEILNQLRRDHRSTRRIALTAWPPGAVREEVFDRYDVDELLIKGHLTLAHLREVVQAASERASAHLPADVRAARSALWEEFRIWRDDRVRRLIEKRRILRDDLRISGRARGQGAADSGKALAVLESRLAAVEAECARIDAVMTSVASLEDVAAASLEIDNMKIAFADTEVEES